MAEEISPAAMRSCERFLTERGLLLGDFGFTADPGKVERGKGTIIFYHYTRLENLENILDPKGGLRARLSVEVGHDIPEFSGHYLVEGLLEPLPQWMTTSPYFSDVGLEMLDEYVGNVLLRVELPQDYPGLFVAEYAHYLDAKYFKRRGRAPLSLGWKNGSETTLAYINSYVRADEYQGGHVAPDFKCTRYGQGIAVPGAYISVAAHQPRKK